MGMEGMGGCSVVWGVCASAERGQRDPVVALALDHRDHRLGVRDADVEIAISGQQDAVDPALDIVVARDLIGKLEPGPARGRAASRKPLKRSSDFEFVAGGFEHEARCASIDHDRHLVARAELTGKAGQRGLDQRQLVGARHRARDIDEKDEIGRWAGAAREIIAAQADAQQPGLRVPRCDRDIGGD